MPDMKVKKSLQCFIVGCLQAAVSSLKQEYKEGDMTLNDAKSLAIKVLSKTLDMNKLTPEKGREVVSCVCVHRTKYMEC